MTNANAWVQIRRDMNVSRFIEEHTMASWLMIAVFVASGLVYLAMPLVVVARALGLALTGFGLVEVIVGAVAARIAARYAAQICAAVAEHIARG